MTTQPDYAVFDELYKKDFFIDREVLEQIIAMGADAVPRLRQMAEAAFSNFESDKDKDWHTNFYLMHALYLLQEIAPEDSFDIFFKLLQQDGEFLDYWFSDSVFEDLPELLIRPGRTHLETLMNFVESPEHSLAYKDLVNKALISIGMYFPEKRDAVVAFFRKQLQHFIAHSGNLEKMYPEDTNEFMSWDIFEYLAFIATDLQKAGMTELEAEIRECHRKNIIEESVAGGENEIEFEEGDTPEPLSSIFERYESMQNSYIGEFSPFHPDHETLKTRQQESMDLLSDLAAVLGTEEDAGEADEKPAWAPQLSPVRDAPKIGRNDPCPCGSGKKYKKCCME
jgi:hypothetical protein